MRLKAGSRAAKAWGRRMARMRKGKVKPKRKRHKRSFRKRVRAIGRVLSNPRKAIRRFRRRRGSVREFAKSRIPVAEIGALGLVAGSMVAFLKVNPTTGTSTTSGGGSSSGGVTIPPVSTTGKVTAGVYNMATGTVAIAGSGFTPNDTAQIVAIEVYPNGTTLKVNYNETTDGMGNFTDSLSFPQFNYAYFVSLTYNGNTLIQIPIPNLAGVFASALPSNSISTSGGQDSPVAAPIVPLSGPFFAAYPVNPSTFPVAFTLYQTSPQGIFAGSTMSLSANTQQMVGVIEPHAKGSNYAIYVSWDTQDWVLIASGGIDANGPSGVGGSTAASGFTAQQVKSALGSWQTSGLYVVVVDTVQGVVSATGTIKTIA